MEKASKKLILFTFLVIALMVIEGGAIAKVEASRVLPAEAEAEALIATLESTLTNTGGYCPFPCTTDRQCQSRLCGKTRCEYIQLSLIKHCV